MIKLRAKFDGRVIIPEQPVSLPTDRTLDIEVRTEDDEQGLTALEKLAQIADSFPSDPNSPRDAAAQHDHYLYGTPKRP